MSIIIGEDNNHIFYNTILACVIALAAHQPTDPLYPRQYDDSLATANETIAAISSDLATVYQDAKSHNSLPNQARSVFMLGYAQFYNTEAPQSDCPPLTLLPTPPVAITQQINSLVLSLNAQIQAAVNMASVRCVDIDGGFNGHRICDSEMYFQADLDFSNRNALPSYCGGLQEYDAGFCTGRRVYVAIIGKFGLG